MKSLTFFSPSAGRAGKERSVLARPLLHILVCLCVFFTAAGIFASGMAPTSDGTGGNIRFHLSSPGVNCDHDPVTVFGNLYKKASDDQTYNLVIPIGTSFYYLGVDFEDKDYFVSDQGVYSLWSNDSTYNITYSGVSSDGPIIANMTGQSSGDIASFGISGNAIGVDPGHYPTSLTVTDLGSPTQSNVTDTLEVFNLDIWAIDLAEEPGTISLYPDEVYEIDLTAIPADFPHENVCGISVSWLGTLPLPGMGSDSHLYLDSTCQDQITEDPGSWCVKKWTYGADGTPQKIYYKRPASYNSADTIYITLSVNNTTMIQKQLMFNDVSVAHLKYIDSPMTGTGNIKGFWTHNIGVYPDREWEIDENEDWINSDVIGYTGGDKNRPFVFHTGDQFSLEKAAFKAVGNSNLSSYGYGVNVRMYDYLGTGLIGNANNSGEYEADLEHDIGPGDTMSVINSETVCVNLTVGLDTFRTKHKVYTIGGSLTGDNNYHTLIDLGCEAAKGLYSFEEDEIFNRIFGKYATLDIRRIDGEGPITYWQYGADNTNNAGDVLATLNGRCGTWADMFTQTCALQGVTVGNEWFRLKNGLWYDGKITPSDLGLESGRTYYKYGYYNGIYYGIQLLQEATAYQGGSDSCPELAYFIDHEINTYGGKYYDVTCGWGPYDTLNDYLEDAVYFRIFRATDDYTVQINHYLDESDFDIHYYFSF